MTRILKAQDSRQLIADEWVRESGRMYGEARVLASQQQIKDWLNNHKDASPRDLQEMIAALPMGYAMFRLMNRLEAMDGA